MTDYLVPSNAQPSEPKAADVARAEEFIEELNNKSKSGSIVKDLCELLTEMTGAEYPQYGKEDGETVLVAMVPDNATRIKGVELILKCLKILNAEPTVQVNVPIIVKWQD